MAVKLKDIAITHISLVDKGANMKGIIYKSVDTEPSYLHTIAIAKSDDEKGIVYGIVYAPDEVDTDGEYTDADEIMKAAYAFMKNQNTINVDKQHDFKNVDAFVAESWIVKEGDPIFPNEPVGAWAVAIQLESEELKKGVKNGDIGGISMAGTAEKAEDEPSVAKADEKSFSLNDMVDMFKKVFGYTSFSMHGNVINNEADVIKTQEKGEELKKEEIEKAIKDGIKKAVDDEVKKAIEPLEKKVEALEKERDELKEALKMSKQYDTPPAGGDITKNDDKAGIL